MQDWKNYDGEMSVRPVPPGVDLAGALRRGRVGFHISSIPLTSPFPSAERDAAHLKSGFVQLVVNIVVLASIYALIACGYVLIYRVSRVLNLAHGELMMLGAYMVLATASLFTGIRSSRSAAAILLSLLVGALVYVFLMRKMTGEMVLAAILTTVALGILMRGVVVLIWSAQQQYPAQALGVPTRRWCCSAARAFRLCPACWCRRLRLVYAALFAFLRFGRWGMRMRAAGQNPLLAAQRGINLHGVYALAWSLSTLTGALAGMLMALDSGVDRRHGRDRAQGLSRGAGRRSRQPRWAHWSAR